MKITKKNNLNLFAFENNKEYVVKPFLKWAGGKSQLLKQFENYFPEELKSGKIENYYEPFLGGGAVFFHIKQKYQIKNSFLFDINPELILIYNVVKNDISLLVKLLKDMKREYFNLIDDKRKKYYYAIRNELNKNLPSFNYSVYSSDWISRAAQLIFLNKTCFNGLFRQNSRGEFNVPFGKYKNPAILDEKNLFAASVLLQNAKIEVLDFRDLIKKVKEKSFIYFDPPYRPLNRTSNFTAYSKFDFGENEQLELATLFSKLSSIKNVKLMLSNSDPKNLNKNDNFFEDLYSKFNISRVSANRMINCVAEKRGKINELIITNY